MCCWTCWTLSHCYLDAKLNCAFHNNILFTVSDISDKELIMLHIHKLPSGCWDICTLYPICWWVSCSTSRLFPSYVERQMCDWIYKRPQEDEQHCELVCDGNVVCRNMLRLCPVGQSWQIASQRLIWFMIMVFFWAGWQSFYLQSLKWNWSSHAQVRLQAQSSLKSNVSHTTAHLRTSPAYFPVSSLPHLHILYTYTCTACVIFLLHMFFPVTICKFLARTLLPNALLQIYRCITQIWPPSRAPSVSAGFVWLQWAWTGALKLREKYCRLWLTCYNNTFTINHKNKAQA